MTWLEVFGAVGLPVVAAWAALAQRRVLQGIVEARGRAGEELRDLHEHHDGVEDDLRLRIAEAEERAARAERKADELEARLDRLEREPGPRGERGPVGSVGPPGVGLAELLEDLNRRVLEDPDPMRRFAVLREEARRRLEGGSPKAPPGPVAASDPGPWSPASKVCCPLCREPLTRPGDEDRVGPRLVDDATTRCDRCGTGVHLGCAVELVERRCPTAGCGGGLVGSEGWGPGESFRERDRLDRRREEA